VRRTGLRWSPACSLAAGFRSWLLLPFGEKVGMRGGSGATLSLGQGFGFSFGLVARWLACGGLSLACRPASSFSLLAQREGTKRNGLSSPPTLQALGLEAFWNLRGSSCSTHGHTAPSPSTEAREGVSWLAVLGSFTSRLTVRSGLAGRLPHRYGCIARRRVPIGNPSRQDIGRTVVGAGRNSVTVWLGQAWSLLDDQTFVC
jgi:hypothetical protein